MTTANGRGFLHDTGRSFPQPLTVMLPGTAAGIALWEHHWSRHAWTGCSELPQFNGAIPPNRKEDVDKAMTAGSWSAGLTQGRPFSCSEIWSLKRTSRWTGIYAGETSLLKDSEDRREGTVLVVFRVHFFLGAVFANCCVSMARMHGT